MNEPFCLFPSLAFVDEGSVPPVLVHVVLPGTVLDESFRFGNARPNYGGLLGGKKRLMVDEIRQRRASRDGQSADTEASLRQAEASV